MAGQIVDQLDHQVKLRKTLGQVLLVALILFEVVIQGLME